MKLYGFKCDFCGRTSRQLPGKWLEVITMSVRADDHAYGVTGLRSDGLHYCTKDCLKGAIDRDWKD